MTRRKGSGKGRSTDFFGNGVEFCGELGPFSVKLCCDRADYTKESAKAMGSDTERIKQAKKTNILRRRCHTHSQ
jgi:hypothetical protein